MTGQSTAYSGWFTRWREQRRAKRQQALERQYFEHERARSAGGHSDANGLSNASIRANAYGTQAMGFGAGLGGDGGGGDGGG